VKFNSIRIPKGVHPHVPAGFRSSKGSSLKLAFGHYAVIGFVGNVIKRIPALAGNED
jgi:hypothetical protein